MYLSNPRLMLLPEVEQVAEYHSHDKGWRSCYGVDIVMVVEVFHFCIVSHHTKT